MTAASGTRKGGYFINCVNPTESRHYHQRTGDKGRHSLDDPTRVQRRAGTKVVWTAERLRRDSTVWLVRSCTAPTGFSAASVPRASRNNRFRPGIAVSTSPQGHNPASVATPAALDNSGRNDVRWSPNYTDRHEHRTKNPTDEIRELCRLSRKAPRGSHGAGSAQSAPDERPQPACGDGPLRRRRGL